MAKETDKIVKQHEGYREVSAEAKKGIAAFLQFDSMKALLAKRSEAVVLKNFNRMTRVDAINTVNRPEATPSAIRELGKLAKAADAETQAEIAKATQEIIDRAKAKAESSK